MVATTRPAPIEGGAERGFSLIEVLVALVITAIALGALFQGAGGSMAATRAAGRYDEAISRARSHLAAVGHGTALVAATARGEEGHGFTWEVAIAPIATAPTPPAEEATGTRAAALALFAVQVTESWQEGETTRRVRLVTRRIGTAAP